ncbi:MAG: alpha/beta hydrolase [Gammaproteobacteria bacterium]|jgi:pimeloyl-ACP methyl ester carboxylesterase|nr:alpha/beta hydrolase [Gammaproteobacteria bacterium]MBP6050699.1 alpha/beta hydrolase [Pseudomonadales bacterium]MBK6585514.1 alpha/beta hydrolase [Gammaproteobacteria bacterium]MBK7520992.1 alpha/beta hydrolase [Gammaproteobacteria bacterium]MBK7728769.1 alpha/beta hydrolase [Gammaproteobacteria bacterium]
MSSSEPSRHQAPRTLYAALEFGRAVQELSSLLPTNRWLSRLPHGEGQPVMTLPGFGGADGSTALMRRYITRWGYEAHPWRLGRNLNPGSAKEMSSVLDFMDTVIGIVGKQLHDIKKKSGKRVSLVGWSLGGLYSRQLAATYPDLVRQVITLGTPFGDPRSTIVWPIMQRLRETREPPEADMQRWMERARIPLEVPLSVIWSKTDGFVHPSIACETEGPRTENIHVCSSHAGFGVNPQTFYVLADRLAQPEGQWSPFERHGWRRLLYSGKPVRY